MKIDFEIISHNRQRYNTCGDWLKKSGVWYFRISKLKDRRYCWLIFFHEFVEWGLCQLQGVKQKDVDQFDMAYGKARTSEAERPPCGCAKFMDEPGNDIHAPYRDAHQTATQCERIIAKALGVEWDDYERAIEALG